MTIRTELMKLVQAAGFTQPIAWPGVNFTPPSSGAWLQVSLFENEPLQPGTANTAAVGLRGTLQISACGRPGTGFAALDTLADSVIAEFAKGTPVLSASRVIRTPYKLGDITADDKLMIPVRIEYGP